MLRCPICGSRAVSVRKEAGMRAECPKHRFVSASLKPCGCPTGTIAGPEVRLLRVTAHRKFDLAASGSGLGKTRMRHWMTAAGMKRHFGLMGRKELNDAIAKMMGTFGV